MEQEQLEHEQPEQLEPEHDVTQQILNLPITREYELKKRGLMSFIINLFTFNRTNKIKPTTEPITTNTISKSQPLRKVEAKEGAVISIVTTHGCITCSPSNENCYLPNVFIVPDGMTIIKISIVMPGIVAYSDNIDIDDYLKTINEYSDVLLSDKVQQLDLKVLLEGLNKTRIELYNRMTKKRKRYVDMDVMDHFRYYSKEIRAFILNSGDTIVNKKYGRNEDEKDWNDFSILEITHKYDIDPALFMPLLPDLLDNRQVVNNEQIITCEELVEHYKQKNVQTLFIFDFSCSTFVNENRSEINPRSARYSRRIIKTENFGFGGKRKIKKRKKTKKDKKTKRQRLKVKN